MAKLTKIQSQKAGLDLMRKSNKTVEKANKANYMYDFYSSVARKTDIWSPEHDYFRDSMRKYVDRRSSLADKSHNQFKEADKLFSSGGKASWKTEQRFYDLIANRELYPNPVASMPKSKKKRGPDQSDAELEAGFAKLK